MFHAAVTMSLLYARIGHKTEAEIVSELGLKQWSTIDHIVNLNIIMESTRDLYYYIIISTDLC